jgi:osmotically-inducible protein OsmY
MRWRSHTTAAAAENRDRVVDAMKRIITIAMVISTCAIFSGCSRSQTDKPRDDAAITAAVRAKLTAVFGPIEAKQVSQLDRGANEQTVSYIEVHSVNGVITLTGEVSGKRAKAKAAEIARSVPQVVSVNNNLSLAPGYSDDALGDGK